MTSMPAMVQHAAQNDLKSSIGRTIATPGHVNCWHNTCVTLSSFNDKGEHTMNTRRLIVSAVTFSFACGFLPIGMIYADSGPCSSQASDLTPAEVKAAAAREQAEAARAAAEQAEKEAVAAQVKAANEKQNSTAERVAELERELAEFKAQETERGLVLILGDVQFAPNHEKLTAEAMRKLYPLVTMLKEQLQRPIRIAGHTDSSGEKSYTLDLSQRRADAVRDFLIANGIRAERITARGYGEEKAVASNDTAAGRRENRRVEVVVPKAGKSVANR
jgi:outer membrane protein OmpA-like peptidoglycan-associated protein